MNINVMKEIGRALLFILLQALLFNQIHLFGVAIPLVFIYIILRLPTTLSTAWVLTIAFALGLSVDIFSDTPGMNALACTIMAFMRRPVLSLYLSHGSDHVSETPSIRALGLGVYARYVFTMSFLYSILLFVIESFTLFDFMYMLLRIVCSAVLTFVLILCIDSLSQSREKRL